MSISVSVFVSFPPRVLCVCSPHPGYPSSYERGLFDEWGCNPVVEDESWGRSTGELVVAANASMSQASTVGGQSLSVGKPHTYTSRKFEDVFTEAGLILSSPTETSLVLTLNGEAQSISSTHFLLFLARH